MATPHVPAGTAALLAQAAPDLEVGPVAGRPDGLGRAEPGPRRLPAGRGPGRPDHGDQADRAARAGRAELRPGRVAARRRQADQQATHVPQHRQGGPDVGPGDHRRRPGRPVCDQCPHDHRPRRRNGRGQRHHRHPGQVGRRSVQRLGHRQLGRPAGRPDTARRRQGGRVVRPEDHRDRRRRPAGGDPGLPHPAQGQGDPGGDPRRRSAHVAAAGRHLRPGSPRLHRLPRSGAGQLRRCWPGPR